jgi:hypothetical protein
MLEQRGGTRLDQHPDQFYGQGQAIKGISADVLPRTSVLYVSRPFVNRTQLIVSVLEKGLFLPFALSSHRRLHNGRHHSDGFANPVRLRAVALVWTRIPLQGPILVKL